MEVSLKSLHCPERLEAYRSPSVSYHLHLKWNLSSGRRPFLMGLRKICQWSCCWLSYRCGRVGVVSVGRFEAVVSHHWRSAPPAERSGTVSGADLDPLARSPDPSLESFSSFVNLTSLAGIPLSLVPPLLNFSSSFHVRRFGVLLASLALAFLISIDKMLRDLCSWFHSVILRAVPVPTYYVLHPFRPFNTGKMWHIMYSWLSLSLWPLFMSSVTWSGVDAVCVSDPFSVLVVCFASFDAIATLFSIPSYLMTNVCDWTSILLHDPLVHPRSTLYSFWANSSFVPECCMLRAVDVGSITNTYLWFPVIFLVLVVLFLFSVAAIRPSTAAFMSSTHSNSVWFVCRDWAVSAYLKQSWLDHQMTRRMAALLGRLYWTMRLLSHGASRYCKHTWKTVHTYPNPFRVVIHDDEVLQIWCGCNVQPPHLSVVDWLLCWASLPLERGRGF